MRLLLRGWVILSHSLRRALSSPLKFVGVLQLVFLECLKHVLLSSCLENILAITFGWLLPPKGNHSPSKHGVVCNSRPLIWSHLQLLQLKGLQYVWGSDPYIEDQSELHFEWYGDRCAHQWRCQHRPLLHHHQIWHFRAQTQGCFEYHVLSR